MTIPTQTESIAVAVISIALSSAGFQRTQESAASGTSHPVDTATLAPVGTVDDRYQSFNVEMLEVTGGKFWKPLPQFREFLEILFDRGLVKVEVLTKVRTSLT